MTDKPETRGRKPLPKGQRKPPQATVKVNEFILPFVKELKGNLKNNTLSDETLQRLFSILRGEDQLLGNDTHTNQARIYDGTTALHGAVVELIDCPATAKASVNRFTSAAATALGIEKIGNKYNVEQRRAIYSWIESLPIKQVRELE